MIKPSVFPTSLQSDRGVSFAARISTAAFALLMTALTRADDAVPWVIPPNRVAYEGRATSAIAWHPEETLVALGVNRGSRSGNDGNEVLIADKETGERVRTLTYPGTIGEFRFVTWNAQGSVLISSNFTENNQPIVVAWDAATGEHKWDRAGEVLVGVGADGLVVARVRDSGHIVVRDGDTGSEVGIIKDVPESLHKVFYNWAFDVDGTDFCVAADREVLRVFGCKSKTLFAWSIADGRALTAFTIAGHRDEQLPRIAVMNPAGTTLVTGGDDNTVRVWDVKSGAERMVLRGHKGLITSLACSLDGDAVASRSEDSFRTWRTSTRAQVACCDNKGALDGMRQDILGSMSPQNRYIAVSGANMLRLFYFETMREPGVLWHSDRSRKGFLSWRNDGLEIVGSYSDESRRELHRFNVTTGESESPLLVENSVENCIFSPVGNQLLLCHNVNFVQSDLRRVCEESVHDLSTGRMTNVSVVLPCAWHPKGGSIGWIGEIHDGDGTGDRFLCATDTTTGRINRKKLAVSGSDMRWRHYLEGIAWSPDGAFVATWPHYYEKSSDDDCCIIIWDTATGNLLKMLKAPGHEEFHQVAWNSDGSLIAAGCEMELIDGSLRESLRVWAVRSGESLELQEATGETYGVAFSPDGRLMVTSDDGDTAKSCKVTVWSVDGATIRPRGVLNSVIGRGDQSSLAFSPDGRYVARAALFAGAVELWNLSPANPTK